MGVRGRWVVSRRCQGIEVGDGGCSGGFLERGTGNAIFRWGRVVVQIVFRVLRIALGEARIYVGFLVTNFVMSSKT